MNAPAQFRDAMRSAGLSPPDTVEPDGKLHRFSTNGKRGDDSGWYVLHVDGIPAGVFGDWRTDLSQIWHADVGRKLSAQETAAQRALLDAIKRERDAEDARNKTEARKRAAAIWRKTAPAPDDHAYLLAKGVEAHKLHVDDGKLVVPMRDTAGALHSLQFIDGDGTKRFLSGGRVQGCYFAIGEPGGAICICEGYATGASIHEATGRPVAVAFNAGNMPPVARALRKKLPSTTLIICADDDWEVAFNTGLTKAEEAAQAVGGLLAIPRAGTCRQEGLSDFNDLHRYISAAAVKSCIDAAKPMVSDDELVSRCAADIVPKAIRWLWPGRIARGKVSMIAGNPGLGKSQLTLGIAATVSTGGRWPVDGAQCERGRAVILSAEDDAADTIVPRLAAAGADLSQIEIVDAVQEMAPDGIVLQRGFSLKRDVTRLGALLGKRGDVALVIIDPVSAYLGDTDSHKNADVRALLAPLSEFAAKHGVAVVCVSHLNKGNGNDAQLRVMGSLAFVAAARAAWIVAKDPENEKRRLFLPAKNNIGNDQSGLAFSIRSAQVDGSVGAIDTSMVEWEAQAVTVHADDVIGPRLGGEERGALADAKQFLAGLLADGPLPTKQIRSDAEGAGYHWPTVRRAQKALGVEAVKEGMKAGWTWRLPARSLDAHEPDAEAF